MTAFDQMRLLHLKKIPTLYSVDIEADKIFQTKKKKDMLDSENQKQSFRKFHREISVLESPFYKVAGLQLY